MNFVVAGLGCPVSIFWRDMSQNLHGQVGGEMSARFVTFVTMQARQAFFFLGEIADREIGQKEVNLDAARLLIDQLEMIREKTSGNLTKEESDLLGGVLSDLQLAYVRVASSAKPKAQQGSSGVEQGTGSVESAGEADDSAKKRFVKKYGP